ncbi:MAG TPA: S1 RNA-binding domain-containing protein [Symbiobacteriaceae bacterium]|jgi:S1 RNA binding domain protein
MKGRQDGLTGDASLAVGSIVEGTVTGITNFGAFVLLPDGRTGLVHISEVADVFVRDVNEFLKEQDKVQVKILTLDERGRLALSIKQADPNFRQARPRDRRPSQSLEDKISKFLKDSEDKASDLKRIDSKRGGRGTKQSFGD